MIRQLKTRYFAYLLAACLFTLVQQDGRADEHSEHADQTAGAEPAAQIHLDPPIAALLARGAVVIGVRPEHVRLTPIYGDAAAHVQPRLGHLHITLDQTKWHWLQANDDAIVLQGLEHGPHQIKVELADPMHRVIATQEIEFVIP